MSISGPHSNPNGAETMPASLKLPRWDAGLLARLSSAQELPPPWQLN